MGQWPLALALFVAVLPAAPARAQDDVADIPSQDLRAGGGANQRYFLIGPRTEAPKKAAYGLVVILPGGSGDADFHPFVKRIYKNALSDSYLVAQPVAVKWTEGQKIVWPTDKSRVPEMEFTTEEFVEAVIRDVGNKHTLNREHLFTLSWSSSGPAAYALALRKERSVTGSFVAMSVFKPDQLPPLEAAKGQAFYLHHSEDDRVCPFRFAEQARDNLTGQGAKVELHTYEGGHGWRGDVYGDIKTGIEWLEKNHAKPAKKP